jgi:steroid delta-isomerase
VPTPEEMRTTIQRYFALVGRQDVAGVVALLSDDVRVEDPVGGPPGTCVTGREAVAAFFERGFAYSRPEPRPTGPIRACASGDEAAAPFRLLLDLKGRRHELDVIDLFAFDPDGRIRSLRAFWNAREARRLAPARDDSTNRS